jgi:hypothetical protein
MYTEKKLSFFRPQPEYHLQNYPWPGIVKLFPAMESLVSDIPAGDGEKENLFYSVNAVVLTKFTAAFLNLFHTMPPSICIKKHLYGNGLGRALAAWWALLELHPPPPPRPL